jgi:hypothetical protein
MARPTANQTSSFKEKTLITFVTIAAIVLFSAASLVGVFSLLLHP